jgi:hypothetical protein
MKLVAFLAILVLAGPGAAVAQQPQQPSGGLGSVIDILGGILGVGGGGRVHGHAVLAKGETLVVRTDDSRTVAVDVSAIDPRIRGVVQPGDGVTLALGRAPDGDTRGTAVAASDMQLDPPAQGGRTYHQIGGTVAEATASRVVFRTREGMTIPLDVTAITGLPALRAGEPATLIYEQGATHGVVAVWIEPGAAASASIDSTRPRPGEGNRVHGMVETVTLNGFALVADDGRRVMVETSRASSADVRPGDYVTVVGRLDAGGDTFVADRIRRDTRRR